MSEIGDFCDFCDQPAMVVIGQHGHYGRICGRCAALAAAALGDGASPGRPAPYREDEPTYSLPVPAPWRFRCTVCDGIVAVDDTSVCPKRDGKSHLETESSRAYRERADAELRNSFRAVTAAAEREVAEKIVAAIEALETLGAEAGRALRAAMADRGGIKATEDLRTARIAAVLAILAEAQERAEAPELELAIEESGSADG